MTNKVITPTQVDELVEQLHKRIVGRMQYVVSEAKRLANESGWVNVPDSQVKSAGEAEALLILQELHQTLSKVHDKLSVTNANRLIKTFVKLHWWPVLGFPEDFYQSILDLIEQGQTRKVNKYICDWFKDRNFKKLERMIRRWNSEPYFHRRRAIYKQALRAHKLGWYNLSVSALLPLIEGIAAEYLAAKSAMTKRGKAAIVEVIQFRASTDAFEATIQEGLARFLDDSTFQNTTKVLPSGYELNRHGVLHGIHTHYGTEANSIRAFLWLEVIYESITGSKTAFDK